MESAAPSSPSVFPSLVPAEDELEQCLSELLAWEAGASSSQLPSPLVDIHTRPLHCIDFSDPPHLHLLHAQSFAPPQYSPPFSPFRLLPGSPPSKRDWLSSLPPFPPAPPPRRQHRSLSSLADAYSLISSSHSLSAPASSSPCTIQHLSHSTTGLPSPTNLLTTHLSRTHIRQSNEAGRNQCRNHSAPQPAVCGVVFRLSDVKAALQAHLTDSGTQLQEVRQDNITEKAHTSEKLASSKRAIHMCSDRERRQGMSRLYHKLYSLLPHTTAHKVSKCLMLSRTMEYIKSLQTELNELERQKEKALIIVKEKREQINIAKVNDTSQKLQCFAKANFGRHIENGNDSSTSLEKYQSMKKGTSQGIFKGSHSGGLKRCAETKGSVMVEKRRKTVDVSILNNDVNLDTSNDKDSNVAKCVDVSNAEGRPIEACKTRIDVCMRLSREDLLISIYTPKTRGTWSRLLEALQEFDIYALNVTLSTGPDFYHHHIHAKVSSTFKLKNPFDLQERILELATKA